MSPEEAKTLKPGETIVANGGIGKGRFYRYDRDDDRVWAVWEDEDCNMASPKYPDEDRATNINSGRVQRWVPPTPPTPDCPRCEKGFTMEHDYLCFECRYGTGL